jgi:hypothetical protein
MNLIVTTKTGLEKIDFTKISGFQRANNGGTTFVSSEGLINSTFSYKNVRVMYALRKEFA